MKKTLLTFCLLLFFSVSLASAQTRVRVKDLVGTWKLEINLDGAGDTATERVILNSVDGLLDEIDVYMEFKEDRQVRVIVDAFGEKEVEYSSWEINDAGELIIGDSEQLQMEDSVWMFVGNRLESFGYKNGERVKEGENVYLRRVKK